MSVDTATIERVQLPKPHDAKEVQVTFRTEIEDADLLAWRQVNDILYSSLRESGFPQSVQTAAGDRSTSLELPVPVVVAPGIVVEGAEYEQRYGSVDLEHYRQQMSPELFKAFVRHIGRIPGTPDLDLGDIVSTPE